MCSSNGVQEYAYVVLLCEWAKEVVMCDCAKIMVMLECSKIVVMLDLVNEFCYGRVLK